MKFCELRGMAAHNPLKGWDARVRHLNGMGLLGSA